MNYSILLVDDNRMFIDIQKEFLEYTNTNILVADNGLSALEVIQAQHPDIIFMDLNMPKMNGAECCRTIKSNPSLANIPVVMVTSKNKKEDIDLCYSMGCDGFLTKPLDRNTFLNTARNYLPNIDRRGKRIAVSIDAVLRLKDETIECKMYNLGVGGAFLSTTYIGIPDSVVQISFTLPEGTVIDCHGRIAWMNRIVAKNPRGIGICFALMPQNMQEKLKQYITTMGKR